MAIWREGPRLCAAAEPSSPANTALVNMPKLITVLLGPAEGAADRGDHRDGQQPAKNVQPGGHRERRALRIKVAGLPERRRGDQHVEGVQGRVEGRVRAGTHGDRMASGEDQPSGDESPSE